MSCKCVCGNVVVINGAVLSWVCAKCEKKRLV